MGRTKGLMDWWMSGRRREKGTQAKGQGQESAPEERARAGSRARARKGRTGRAKFSAKRLFWNVFLIRSAGPPSRLILLSYAETRIYEVSPVQHGMSGGFRNAPRLPKSRRGKWYS